jgi:hypothetical protein
MNIQSKTWALALALVTALTISTRAATVTATLDPQQIEAGDAAQLTVTVTGSQGQPQVPSVPGLDIQAVGQSTQIEIVNGSMTANASVTYSVTPQHEGTFVIPAIRAGGAASQPITLRVGKGSGGVNAPAQALPPPSIPQVQTQGQSSGPVVLPPQGVAQAPANNAQPPSTTGRFGSIEVTLPKKEFYVGELVPVDVKAYIPGDVQANVTDLPQFTSDGFTLNPLSTKPEQTVEDVNGREYRVLTWHTALAGVKVGDYPFSLQMPMSVVVRQQMPRMDDDDSFNSFFNNALSAFGTKKNITLQSPDETLKVLPLPQANRPADFAGAVGQFELETSASPTKVNAGDPITLNVKITGKGNFDRVSSDGLASDSSWKTYSTKSQFEPADSVGYQGDKTFSQPIIANDSTVTSIPSLSFSFFNPETRQYVTRTAPPIAVTIRGSASNGNSVASAGPVVTPSQAQNPSPTPTANLPASDLRPNKIEQGATVASLRPLYLNPLFLGAQALPLLALIGGLAFLRTRKEAAHPERIRTVAFRQAVRQEIEAMDEAMRNHQSDAFFIHARGALQQQFGHKWKLRPETITLADIEARLGEAEVATIRPIFQMADQVSYSSLGFEDADLGEWRQIVVNELSETN